MNQSSKKNKPKKSVSKSAYQRAGVDIKAGDSFVQAIRPFVSKTQKKHQKFLRTGLGGYASLYQIQKNLWIAASTDGVGTKLKMAFHSGNHSTIGVDLVAMSVNDLLCVGAKPLFFLDYLATGKLNVKTSISILSGVASGCLDAGIALVGGETAEMPSLYKDGEYDLAGFAVGIASEDDLFLEKNVKTGQVLIGIESSGPHSNGFSLIRKLLGKNKKLWKQSFKPTKIYSKEVHLLKTKLGKNLKAVSHITGSGFLNLPRINEGFNYKIDFRSKSQIPKLFWEYQKLGKLTLEDLFTTFNMGFGLVACVDPAFANIAIQTLKNNGVKAQKIGLVDRKCAIGKSIIHINVEDQKLTLKY